MPAIAPTAPQERIGLLDALRGFAVFGIFVANMLHMSGYFFLGDATRSQLFWSRSDHVVESLITLFVEGKFYSLFSLLFGIGFAVILARCEASGRSVNRFFARRMSVLLAIGLAHAVFIWLGDILTLYALVGFALLLFRKRSDRVLLLSAVVLFALPVVQYMVMMSVSGTKPFNPQNAAQQVAFMERVVQLMAHGTVGDMMKMNVGGLLFGRYPDLLFTGRIFKVLATFLVGLYIGRNRIFVDPQAWRMTLHRVAVWGFVIGLPLNVVLSRLAISRDYEHLAPMGLVESIVYGIGVPALAFAYAASFTLLWLKAPRRFAFLEPVGRMALSNYLLQSVVGLLLFKTVGLGLMGRVGATAGTLIVLVVYAGQIVFSHFWLRLFRFGPAEWLWRSLTYGQLQPMKRSMVPVTVEA
jgi:uncharacterized protein